MLAHFDRVQRTPADVAVRPAEMDAAERASGETTMRALRYAAGRIERFHRESAPRSWRMTDSMGSRLRQDVRPINPVAADVPGGRAADPSTALMTVTPPRRAG